MNYNFFYKPTVATKRNIMQKYIFSAEDKSNVIVKKEGSEDELQKFSLGSVSSNCLLCCSDGSLVKVSNDNNVIEFSKIIQGSASIYISNADALFKVDGTLEIEGNLTWFTFMSYPQKLIIPQE